MSNIFRMKKSIAMICVLLLATVLAVLVSTTQASSDAVTVLVYAPNSADVVANLEDAVATSDNVEVVNVASWADVSVQLSDADTLIVDSVALESVDSNLLTSTFVNNSLTAIGIDVSGELLATELGVSDFYANAWLDSESQPYHDTYTQTHYFAYHLDLNGDQADIQTFLDANHVGNPYGTVEGVVGELEVASATYSDALDDDASYETLVQLINTYASQEASPTAIDYNNLTAKYDSGTIVLGLVAVALLATVLFFTLSGKKKWGILPVVVCLFGVGFATLSSVHAEDSADYYEVAHTTYFASDSDQPYGLTASVLFNSTSQIEVSPVQFNEASFYVTENLVQPTLSDDINWIRITQGDGISDSQIIEGGTGTALEGIDYELWQLMIAYETSQQYPDDQTNEQVNQLTIGDLSDFLDYSMVLAHVNEVTIPLGIDVSGQEIEEKQLKATDVLNEAGQFIFNQEHILRSVKAESFRSKFKIQYAFALHQMTYQMYSSVSQRSASSMYYPEQMAVKNAMLEYANENNVGLIDIRTNKVHLNSQELDNLILSEQTALTRSRSQFNFRQQMNCPNVEPSGGTVNLHKEASGTHSSTGSRYSRNEESDFFCELYLKHDAVVSDLYAHTWAARCVTDRYGAVSRVVNGSTQESVFGAKRHSCTWWDGKIISGFKHQ